MTLQTTVIANFLDRHKFHQTLCTQQHIKHTQIDSDGGIKIEFLINRCPYFLFDIQRNAFTHVALITIPVAQIDMHVAIVRVN